MREYSKIKAYLIMGIGIFCSITFFVFLDIQLSLSQIRENNPGTWSNMSPEIRYFFIPLIFAPIFAISSLFTFVFEMSYQIKNYKYWFFQGLSFGIVLSVFPLVRLKLTNEMAVVISLLLTVICIILIRKKARVENAL